MNLFENISSDNIFDVNRSLKMVIFLSYCECLLSLAF